MVTIRFTCDCGVYETLTFKHFKEETIWPNKMHVVGLDSEIKCTKCHKVWLKANVKDGDICS